MKILINRKPVEGPWGGGNLFVKNFCDVMKKLGHEVVHNIQDDIDIFFIVNPRYDELGISINEAIEYKINNNKTKIIQRINDCDARKNTSNVDNMLLQCSSYLDGTIFVSDWMMEYFLKKGWNCKKNFTVINGVELQKDTVEQKEKIRNEKVNIVTHHWSDNFLKGFDIYEKLDDMILHDNKFTFTYIGRHRNTFKNTKIIQPLLGQELLKELKKYDVYVTASRYDPGPNHVIEAVACNLPIFVHKDGGGAVEFGKSKNNENIFENYDDLYKMLNDSKYYKSKNNFVDWEECLLKLNEIIKSNF